MNEWEMMQFLHVYVQTGPLTKERYFMELIAAAAAGALLLASAFMLTKATDRRRRERRTREEVRDEAARQNLFELTYGVRLQAGLWRTVRDESLLAGAAAGVWMAVDVPAGGLRLEMTLGVGAFRAHTSNVPEALEVLRAIVRTGIPFDGERSVAYIDPKGKKFVAHDVQLITEEFVMRMARDVLERRLQLDVTAVEEIRRVHAIGDSGRARVPSTDHSIVDGLADTLDRYFMLTEAADDEFRAIAFGHEGRWLAVDYTSWIDARSPEEARAWFAARSTPTKASYVMPMHAIMNLSVVLRSEVVGRYQVAPGETASSALIEASLTDVYGFRPDEYQYGSLLEASNGNRPSREAMDDLA